MSWSHLQLSLSVHIVGFDCVECSIVTATFYFVTEATISLSVDRFIDKSCIANYNMKIAAVLSIK